MNRRRHILSACLVGALCFALMIVGCDEQDDPEAYVARVGDRYLRQDDLERQLQALPARPDSAVARQQIIEQWVTNELLYQEADRRGLRDDEEVQRLLEESERNVLVNALISEMYEESEITPSPAEMQSYYERHKEQLRLRESFVRVRYVETDTRDQAEQARSAIQQASIAQRDSVWESVIDRLAADPSLATDVSSDFYPESRIFAGKPALREALNGLLDGQTAPIIQTDSTFIVMQLAQRVPAQTVPQPEWIEDELARRLIIQGRKQLYARQVQRLRNEALAREDLEIK